MITFVVIINVGLLILLTITLVNVLTGPYLRKKITQQETPRVSVLIPARNEERNIEGCIRSLMQQDYPDLEIIVLDDESSDKTAEIIQRLIMESPRLIYKEGKSLPEGWTGKNWACHQLSEFSTGEILIFSDADNRYADNAISRTVARMQKYNLDMLSAFPQQITGSFFEKLVVPVIDLLLYSSLVLWLTYYVKFPSLAAANGQWIAFRAESYRKIGGHNIVKDKIVEDVELSRSFKRQQYRIMTCAGTGIVYGRMYQSAHEVWQGFSKNLFGLLSYRTIPFFTILLGFIIVFILPYVLVFSKELFILSFLAVLQNLFLRLSLAIGYKHPPLISIIMHPFSILFIILIALDSFRKTTVGTHYWKDREIKVNSLKI